MLRLWMLIALVTGPMSSVASAGDVAEPPAGLSAAERGYWYLTNREYLPPDFDQALFDQLWRLWPEPYRTEAEQATEAKRREMTFRWYGLVRAPGADELDPAMGYVSDGQGGWVMNCLACHGGTVAGQAIPGLPNSHFAMQTLVDDVRLAKVSQLKPLAHLDKASLGIPLSTSDGTTNAVVFGIVVGALRKPDMSVDTSRKIPPLVHHDMDAPPFWNVRKKSRLYIDGFAPKAARPLVQFMLIPQNDRETILSWEDDFEDVLAWIESLEPPVYPWTIDESLAERGRLVFADHCSECHGTYGAEETYPERMVDLDVIGTDPVRLEALAPEHRRWMKNSWMSRYGEDEVILNPTGYIAPPLDGIWASAPYFHNGSVPTLWHVLHPDERPAVWRRTRDGYDTLRVGCEITVFDAIPETVTSPVERRRYFDTGKFGKSAGGHRFPDALTEPEKQAVLEYLKTL